MTIYAYKRCSSVTEGRQDVARQLFGLEFDEVFIEYASGKNEENRPVFQELKSVLKSGDEVWFNDLSRAGRNTKQLLNTVEDLISRGVKVVFKTENLTFVNEETDPMQGAISKMLLTMLSSVNELFLTQTKIAVKQGLERVKKESPEKLRKTTGSKWHETYTKNRDAGKHSTTKLFKPSPQKDKLIVDIKTAISYGSPKSFVELADKLNKNKVFTLGNKPWNGRTLSTFCQRNEIKL
ncbi:serine recombinase family protein [Vibrio phage vB_VpaM_R16F]|nr:serine recombinase family protein [Vibrio phage vB_VpaM_R16F]